MNKIIINGKTILTSGRNIVISGDCIICDGTTIQTGLSGIVEVKFEGDLATLKCDGSAKITGDIKGNVDVEGSLECRNIGGDVDVGGSVDCGDVGGDIDAGGSVKMKR